MERHGSVVSKSWYVSSFSFLMLKCFLTIVGSLEKVESEDMSHLQTCLGQAIKFRKTLEVKDPDSLPPLAVLASNSRATRVGCVVKEIDGSKIYDFSKGSTVMGDGRVPFENATPPRDCNYKVYTTDKEHSAILDDVEKVEQIINELTL